MRGLIAVRVEAVERVFGGRSGLFDIVYFLLQSFLCKKQCCLDVGHIFFSFGKFNCFDCLIQSANNRIQRKLGQIGPRWWQFFGISGGRTRIGALAGSNFGDSSSVNAEVRGDIVLSVTPSQHSFDQLSLTIVQHVTNLVASRIENQVYADTDLMFYN